MACVIYRMFLCLNEKNAHFRLCFKARPSTNLSFLSHLYILVHLQWIKLIFISHEELYTWPRFEIEAKGNSERVRLLVLSSNGIIVLPCLQCIRRKLLSIIDQKRFSSDNLNETILFFCNHSQFRTLVIGWKMAGWLRHSNMLWSISFVFVSYAFS